MQKAYLYVVNIDTLDVNVVMDSLSDARRAYIQRCVDEQTMRQRAASELLCAYALRELGEDVTLPLAIALQENGKPYLPDSQWNFNISHSGSYVCCAVAQNLQLGVDVEKITERDYKALAERFCSDMELYRLLRVTDEKLKMRFYEFWVRKEALAKRDGVVQKDFKKVDVTKWHVCCYEENGYMWAVAADKAFELVVRRLDENWLENILTK